MSPENGGCIGLDFIENILKARMKASAQGEVRLMGGRRVKEVVVNRSKKCQNNKKKVRFKKSIVFHLQPSHLGFPS